MYSGNSLADIADKLREDHEEYLDQPQYCKGCGHQLVDEEL